MNYTKIKAGEFKVGEELRQPVYDSDGNLLLGKGQIIASERQLDSLMQRGLYQVSMPHSEKEKPRERQDKGSPFSRVIDLAQRLPILYQALLDADEDAYKRVYRFGHDIQRICELDSDALIAVMHLCHQHAYTVYHPLHQAIFCEVVGISSGFNADQRLSIIAAALTANISIIELQETLYVQEAPLTSAQRRSIDEHPEKSIEVLQRAGVTDQAWLNAVLQHHENNNGEGYPQGLTAESISKEAAFIAVADRYTAMVSSRSYRKPLTAKEALREFFMQRNGEYHEELALISIKELGIYPPGSFVRLENGETAVVVKRSKKDSMSPLVCSFMGPRGELYANPLKRDCAIKEYTIKETCRYDECDKLNLNIFWGYC